MLSDTTFCATRTYCSYTDFNFVCHYSTYPCALQIVIPSKLNRKISVWLNPFKNTGLTVNLASCLTAVWSISKSHLLKDRSTKIIYVHIFTYLYIYKQYMCFDREKKFNESDTFWFKEGSESDLTVQRKEYVRAERSW